MGIQQHQVGEPEATPPVNPPAPHFRPYVVGNYVHDDEERADRLRAARRDEQEMLGGDR